MKYILLITLFSIQSLAQTADFDTAKSIITDSLASKLEQDKEELTSQELALVLIEAHADKRGGREYNMKLTEARALEVKRELERMGVSAKIVTVAKGKTEQLEGKGLAENRRVVITKFKKERVIVERTIEPHKNILSLYGVVGQRGLEHSTEGNTTEVSTRNRLGLGAMYQRRVDKLYLGVGGDTNKNVKLSVGIGF